ncbi:MAG: barstar family protein [Wenzhouxiangella sp.]
MKSEPCWQERLSTWLGQGPALLSLDQPIDPAEIAAQLAAVGLETGMVHLGRVADKDTMMQAFQRDLNWPDWFGANWDALADLLAGPEGAAARPIALILVDWPGFADRAPGVAATLGELIEELSAEPKSLLVGAVLLTGA